MNKKFKYTLIKDNTMNGGYLISPDVKLRWDEYIVGEIDGKGYDKIYYILSHKMENMISKSLSRGYLFGKYNIICAYAAIKPNDFILDIGANIGTFTLPISNIKNVTVYAFEPYAPNYTLLKYNVVRNNINNIKIFNRAVGNKVGYTTISETVKTHDVYDKYKVKYKKLTETTNPGAIRLGKGNVKTKIVTVDSLKLKKLDFMKVDVEGFEPFVFDGAKKSIKKFKPSILFEHNTTNEEFIKIKKELGFDINFNFDIIKYCQTLGYNRIIHIPPEDYMLIHKNKQLNMHDKNFKIKQVQYINKFINNYKRFKIYEYIKPTYTETDINKLINTINLDNYIINVYGNQLLNGVLLKLINLMNLQQKIFVDFGVRSIELSFSRYLTEKHNWTSYLFNSAKMEYNKTKTIIGNKIIINDNKYNLKNIIKYFKKYDIPKKFDILCITDNNSYYYLKRLLQYFEPSIIINYVQRHNLNNEVMEYDKKFKWDYTDYVGYSYDVYNKLMEENGYTYIYTENIVGVTCISIKKSIKEKYNLHFLNEGEPDKLMRKPKYGKYLEGHKKDPHNRKFLTKKQADKLFDEIIVG